MDRGSGLIRLHVSELEVQIVRYSGRRQGWKRQALDCIIPRKTFYSRAGCTGRLRAEAKGLGRYGIRIRPGVRTGSIDRLVESIHIDNISI